jgi:predicted amidohydrolase YtcJ
MWIHKAVNHSNPDERITVQQALRMATINGAYATFDDKDRGSLEEGKFADMVVLSENPYTVPAEAIKKIKVEQLILGGKPYESAKTSLLNCIWKGIISNAKY